MHASPLSRRQLLRSGAMGLPLLLAGCNRSATPLLSCRGDFPQAWAGRMPQGWSLRSLEDPAAVLEAIRGPAASQPGLAQLWDGWANELPRNALQPLAAPALLTRLDPIAEPASRLFGPAGSPPLAFPWAIDPWVLLLRDRPDLARRRREGWSLLLDPSLAGKLVLPSSPRVTITLMGEQEQPLRRLRRQSLASDERNGLQLLLAGDAEALVLPRHRAVPLLRSDPRLSVVLPEQGAPLGWNLLLRPAGSAAALPLTWLEGALKAPLLPRLLAAGWVPPLPRAQLLQAAASLPEVQRTLLVPPEALLQRCWSLPPLAPERRRELQSLWDATAPGSP